MKSPRIRSLGTANLLFVGVALDIGDEASNTVLDSSRTDGKSSSFSTNK